MAEPPICLECESGKHGACDGTAWVEFPGDVIVRMPCVCEINDHQELQRA